MPTQQRSKVPGVLLSTDVGGTNLRLLLATAQGEPLQEKRLPVPTHSVEGFLASLCQAMQGLLHRAGDARLLGIGAAVASPIDQTRGELVHPPHLPGERTPLKQMLAEAFNVPVVLENDANAAAVGEHRVGAGRGTSEMVYVTVSTGIGGGLILGGRLYRGASGGAGEVGHITIAADGPLCDCGKAGCLEALASGRAIAHEAASRIQQGAASTLWQMCSGSLGRIDALMVHQTAQGGDPLSLAVLQRAAHYLGLGLASLVNVFNPQLVVLGGGLTNMADLYVSPALQLAKEHAMPLAASTVRFELARLGDRAGLVGALLLIQEELGLS